MQKEITILMYANQMHVHDYMLMQERRTSKAITYISYKTAATAVALLLTGSSRSRSPVGQRASGVRAVIKDSEHLVTLISELFQVLLVRGNTY